MTTNEHVQASIENLAATLEDWKKELTALETAAEKAKAEPASSESDQANWHRGETIEQLKTRVAAAERQLEQWRKIIAPAGEAKAEQVAAAEIEEPPPPKKKR